jgi:hypothetical protein
MYCDSPAVMVEALPTQALCRIAFNPPISSPKMLGAFSSVASAAQYNTMSFNTSPSDALNIGCKSSSYYDF